MKISEIKIIQKLQNEGYHIVVKNPLGTTFTQKYKVYQNFRWDELKVVIIDNQGNVSGLQG